MVLELGPREMVCMDDVEPKVRKAACTGLCTIGEYGAIHAAAPDIILAHLRGDGGVKRGMTPTQTTKTVPKRYQTKIVFEDNWKWRRTGNLNSWNPNGIYGVALRSQTSFLYILHYS